MGLAVKGSVSPWPAAPDNYLPEVFAAYMVLGIIWMFIDRRAAPEGHAVRRQLRSARGSGPIRSHSLR